MRINLLTSELFRHSIAAEWIQATLSGAYADLRCYLLE
jgi:hypothetical protein